MLLALRSLYENAGDCTVILDSLDLALSLADLSVTGDANVDLTGSGLDLAISLGDLQAGELPVTSGGGGWHGFHVGIPPYVIPQPLPQNANVSLQGISLHIEVGELKASGKIDITDDELLLILAAVAMTDDEPDDDANDREYAELLVATAAFCELAQAASCYDVLVETE